MYDSGFSDFHTSIVIYHLNYTLSCYPFP